MDYLFVVAQDLDDDVLTGAGAGVIQGEYPWEEMWEYFFKHEKAQPMKIGLSH
ncbi:hypothetical protein SAMN04490193_1664 [Pseudomonas marginalis]|uniref:hypothetical protein n=1 Tax=Pseudomonas marginalis TaxID=298 RepID=UPI00089547B8|nr:hypothetical protein [Pseudomonas marginalis]SEB58975.1 hypothetical protein SAMN04490193_1664 [Pseudomonas marginalis]